MAHKFYEIKFITTRKFSEYANDEQELIKKICDLTYECELEQGKDFEIITHTRK